MASVTKYTCDQCGKPVSDLYGVMHVAISSESEPQVNASLDLCSFSCLEAYAANPMAKTEAAAKRLYG